MNYKSEEIKADYQKWLTCEPPHEPFMRLHQVLLVIDALSKATSHGAITLTDFLRPQDFNSYHSKGQAADIRVKDKGKEWYEAMIMFKWVLFRLDWQIQLIPHLELYNKDYWHIHVEVDDNSLQRR